MDLKKPSDLLDKKETSSVLKPPEVTPHITESYNKFVDNFETINEIAEKTKVFEKVDELSERVEFLSKELSEKLTRTDLENAMLSQLMVLDENFKIIQTQVKGLNKEDLREFKSTVSNLSQVVDNLVESELPKYKKQVVKNQVFVGEKVQELQGLVEENIAGIREEVDQKFDSIAEVIDNNLEYFSNKLQETSYQVKKTTETYANLSKIVENKVSKENKTLDEYFNTVETIQKVLTELKTQIFLNEKEFERIDNYLEKNHQDLVKLKEEVFSEIEKLPVGNIQENIERIEKKIDFIKETYSKIEPEVVVKEVIKEGLLNDPPSTDNDDPLTPLDKNFVTLDQLQEHYRLFLNRIQQQLSTLGGGGETRLKYLDDIVGIATNASAYDGKFLKYNNSIGKFEFEDVVSGIGIATAGGTVGTGVTLINFIGPGISTVTASAGIATVNTNAIISDTTQVSGSGPITNIISLTQAQYDAIVSPSSTTLYIITG